MGSTVADLIVCAICLASSTLLVYHLRSTPLQATGYMLGLLISAQGIALLQGPSWSELLSRFALLASSIGLVYELPRTPLAQISERAEEISKAQKFVDGIPFAAFLCAEDGGDLAVNDPYKSVLVVEPGDVLGYLWERRVHEEDRNKVVRWWRDYCAHRTDRNTYRFRWVLEDRTIWIQVTGHHLDNGQHWGRVEDVTERVALEEEIHAIRRP